MLYKLRGAFPLHYTVFKQTAAHIPHEGNSEQLFSRSGALSDSNGKMDPPPGAAGSLDVHRRQLLDLPAEQ